MKLLVDDLATLIHLFAWTMDDDDSQSECTVRDHR